MSLVFNTRYVPLLIAAAFLQVWYVPKAVAVSSSGDNLIDDWVRHNRESSEADPVVSSPMSRADLLGHLSGKSGETEPTDSENRDDIIFDQILGKLVSEITMTVADIPPSNESSAGSAILTPVLREVDCRPETSVALSSKVRTGLRGNPVSVRGP